MYRACETLDAQSLEDAEIFEDVRVAVSEELKAHPILFFKISSVSCKDVAGDEFGPAFKINSIARLWKSIVYSFRIMSEIEDDVESEDTAGVSGEKKDDYAIALRPWNDEISPETEFRCLVVNRKLEAVIRPTTGTLVGVEDFETFNRFVEEHSASFPEETLAMDMFLKPGQSVPEFIEFNPLDEELDTFEADLSSCNPDLLTALKREAVRHWLLT